MVDIWNFFDSVLYENEVKNDEIQFKLHIFRFCKMLKREMFMLITGTIGGGIASCMTAGIQGSGLPMDFVDIVLNGIPVGAQMSSFPLAVRILSLASPKYRDISKNRDKEQVKFYVFGGIGAAAIYTALNYPATVISFNRKIKKQQNKSQNMNSQNKLKNLSMKGYFNAYLDRLGISIGFPWAMNTLQNLVPHSRNSLIEWGRGHLLVCGSNVSARFCAFPIHRLKNGSSLKMMLTKYLKNTPNVMLTGDCVAAVRSPFKFMLD